MKIFSSIRMFFKSTMLYYLTDKIDKLSETTI